MFETKIHEDNSHYNHFSLNPMLIFCVNCILNKLQLIAIEKISFFSLMMSHYAPLSTICFTLQIVAHNGEWNYTFPPTSKGAFSQCNRA